MLPASQRLRSRRDFRQVYARGRSFVHPLLVIYVRPTQGSTCRIGFSISKKLGGAVARNRIKRRLREAVRAYSVKLRPGFDVVFVGRAKMKGASFAAMQQVVGDLFRRAQVLNDPPAPGGPPWSDSAAR